MFKKYFQKIYKLRLKKLKLRYFKNIKEKNEKYISILNHDVKTVLLAQIQALKLYMDNKAPREILENVLNSNYFLYEIVKNAIFLSGLEVSNNSLKLEDINISDVVNDVSKSVEHLAQTKNQNIIFKSKSKKILCRADKHYVNKIIYNILTSAVYYGFEGTSIEVLIEENKDSITFKTKNKSCYMDKEKLKNSFKDKTSSDFNQLGMNLNLSVAGKLISAHNWNVIAHSDKNDTCTLGFIVSK